LSVWLFPAAAPPYARQRLEVSWRSGRVDIALDLPADQIVSVREGSGVVDRRAVAR